MRERPGHSPTDTVLAADGLLVAGDHLLENISSNPIAHVPDRRARPRGPRRVAGPAAHAARPTRSRCSATAADDRGELVLPGHGDPFTGAAALVERGSRCTSGAPRRSSTRWTQPRSAAEVGRDLWRHVPVTQAYLVLSEVLGHLDLLEERGSVRAREEGGVVLYARS